MRGYKFLVMQTSHKGDSTFLTANLGGSGVCADTDTNVTHFRPHDFGGGHDNDNYWNSAEELLVGFSRWYNRIEEKTAYNMGNRIYAATNTYRFFRVNEDLYAREDVLELPNNDLASYEITEEQFIKDMLGSWVFEQVSFMFPDYTLREMKRTPANPVRVKIVYNHDTDSWCWFSDYVGFVQEDYLTVSNMTVPAGMGYEDAVVYLSCISGEEYRFGGNDAYNKKNKK